MPFAAASAVAPLRVAEVRVAAVDDRVARLGEPQQLLEGVLGDLRRRGPSSRTPAARRAGRAAPRASRPSSRPRGRGLHLVAAAPRGASSCCRPCGRGRSCRAASGNLLELDAGDAAAALAQRVEVAGRLGADQPGEAERLAGDRQLGAVVLDDLQEAPGVRAALVELAGRVQVARPEPVRDDAAGPLAERAGEPVDPLARSPASARRTPGCRRSRAARRRRGAPRSSPPARASTSPAASTSFVLSFAACTSGWSNGLIPRIEPATAVANSQRKNSWPSSSGSGSRTSCSLAVGAVGRTRPGRGRGPCPACPVDSASSCSTQSPKTPASGRQTLSRPSLPALAEREAELEARDCPRRGGRRRPSRPARSSRPSRSTPISAAGNEPERRERRVAAADRRLARR